MDARRRGTQILGWLSVIAGYGLALVLIRGAVLGITRGFAGQPPPLDPPGLPAVYRRCCPSVRSRTAHNINREGNSPPSPRFGWGSVLLGSLLLFAAANNRFHVLPKRQALSQLEYQNQTQTAAGNVVTLAICVGSFFLILSGIWKGLRRQRNQP